MEILKISLAVFFVVNCVAAIAIIRSSCYSAAQKAVQWLIIWLLPVFGGIFVWSFLRSQNVSRKMRTSDAYGAGYDNSIVVTDGSHQGFDGGGHGGGLQ